jgi:hypothetical protein
MTIGKKIAFDAKPNRTDCYLRFSDAYVDIDRALTVKDANSTIRIKTMFRVCQYRPSSPDSNRVFTVHNGVPWLSLDYASAAGGGAYPNALYFNIASSVYMGCSVLGNAVRTMQWFSIDATYHARHLTYSVDNITADLHYDVDEYSTDDLSSMNGIQIGGERRSGYYGGMYADLAYLDWWVDDEQTLSLRPSKNDALYDEVSKTEHFVSNGGTLEYRRMSDD